MSGSVILRKFILALALLSAFAVSFAQWSPPNRPTGVTISADRDDLITVRWNLTLGGAFYNILVSYDGGTTWGYIAFGYNQFTSQATIPPATGEPLYAVEVLMFSPPDHISTSIPWMGPPAYYPPNDDPSPKLGADGQPEGKYADPVNLATGTQSYAPHPDLSVYNPNGPAVSFSRTFDSGLSGFGYGSPGLGRGWVHNYDMAISNGGITTAWANLNLVFPNGSKVSLTPQMSGGTPTGDFTVPSGSNFKVTGVPSSTVGTWQSITVTWGDETKWVFDTLIDRYYVPTQIINKAGKGVTLAWDFTRRLTGITDTTTSSTLLTVNYDVSGNLASIADAYGRSVYYSFGTVSGYSNPVLTGASQIVTTGTVSPPSAAGYGYTVINGRPYLHQTTVPSPTGTGTTTDTINYNSTTYQVSSIVDGNGNKTAFTYNSGNTLVEFKDPSNVSVYSWTANYDSMNRDTGRTDALSNSTIIQYNDSSNPNRATDFYDANGAHNSTSYDSFGNVLTATNPQGITTTYTYDYTGFSLGRMSQVQEGLRAATSFTYYSNGLLNTITTPQPNFGGTQTTTYYYDSLGNLTQVDAPGNNATATITTTLNYTTDGTYTQAAAVAQPITITDNLGNVRHLRYDSQGRVISDTDAVGNTNTFAYNIAGAPTQHTLPATGQTGAGQAVIEKTYLFVGGPVSQVKAYNESGVLSRTVSYGYGAEGELLNVSGAAQTTSYTYDAAYRKATVADGNSNVTTYAYNSCGYLYSITPPSGSAITFTSYDPAGNLLTRVDGVGVTTNYVYNGPGGLISDIQYPIATNLNQTFAYDSLARLNSVTDSTGTITTSYDDLNNIVSQTTAYRGVPAQTLTYTYYPSGARHTLTCPAGTWTYYYDGDNRYSSMTSPAGTSTADYFANGWQSKRELPNGVDTFYAYNGAGQLTGLQHGPTLSYLSLYNNFTYDSGFNQTGFSVTDNLTPSLSGTTSYSYDTKNRLTSSASTRGSGYSATLGYDNAFNYTGVVGGTTYTFNSNNQITNTGFTYNGNGNPTTYGGAVADYLPENGLSRFASGFRAVYQSSGLRAWKQNAVLAGGGTIRTHFIYDGTTPLYELNVRGTSITAINVFAPDGLVARKSGGVWSQYLFDPQGSVCQTLDSSGTLVGSSIYNDYGAGSVADTYGYNARWGYYFDQETGFYYCQNRYYDPNRGRWLNRDPIGFSGGVNLYGYVAGNPVGPTDNTGLDPYDYAQRKAVEGYQQGGFWGEAKANFFNGLTALYDTIGGRQVKGLASKTGTAVANGDYPEAIVYGAATVGTIGFEAFSFGRGGGITGSAESLVPEELTTVSRWGRPGLEAGDWVMKGPANRLNYIFSFKWQPGMGNIFTPFSAGEEFTVATSSVRWPTGWGIDGWWKGIFGQRIYRP